MKAKIGIVGSGNIGWALKQLLKEGTLTNEHITILRLPHKHSNNDPHLSAIAERQCANLIYIN